MPTIPVMLTETPFAILTPMVAPLQAQRSALQRVVGTGLLRCAVPTRRGWRLNGTLHGELNRPWEGFSLVAPVRLGDGPTGWVLLRSEEDGLAAQASAAPPVHALDTLTLRNVFFREDEWLGEADLATRLMPVAQALASCRRCSVQSTPAMKA